MMSDLWIAVGVMLVISLSLATAAWGLLRNRHRDVQLLVIAAASFGAFAFLFYAAGRLYWASLIQDSAVIIWSNWTPILLAIAAGVFVSLERMPRVRRLVLASLLGVVGVSATIWPFLGIALRPPPPGGNVWMGPVAMQTSWATCSPAAAATFLTAGNISVSEADMVNACLTDSAGTPTLGLYRGLKTTANRHGRDIEAAQLSMTELIGNDRWPLLLMVKLPTTGVDDPRYQQQWGWVPGLGHSVVALGRDPAGFLFIADPAVGLESWTENDLRVLWHGDAIRFVASE